uniref:Uncharacterized protein n=1 Tax=Cucumis melo TaxID=3656 RepID=A0A9I9E809_CUCME
MMPLMSPDGFRHFEQEEACLKDNQGMRSRDLVEERDGRINLDILTERFRCRKNEVFVEGRSISLCWFINDLGSGERGGGSAKFMFKLNFDFRRGEGVVEEYMDHGINQVHSSISLIRLGRTYITVNLSFGLLENLYR